MEKCSISASSCHMNKDIILYVTLASLVNIFRRFRVTCFYQTTRRHTPEDSIVQSHCQNLKSYLQHTVVYSQSLNNNIWLLVCFIFLPWNKLFHWCK